MRREEDLLGRRRTGEIRRWDLEMSDDADQNIFVERLLLFQQAHDLLGRVVIDVREVALATRRTGETTVRWLLGESHRHWPGRPFPPLVLRQSSETCGRAVHAVAVATSPPLDAALRSRERGGGSRDASRESADSVFGDAVQGAVAVDRSALPSCHLEVGVGSRSLRSGVVHGQLPGQLLPQGSNLLSQAGNRGRVVGCSGKRLAQRFELAFVLALLLDVLSVNTLDFGVLVRELLECAVEACVEFALLLQQRVELSLSDLRLVELGLKRTGAGIELVVLRNPRLELLVQVAQLGLQLPVLARPALERLRELDDLVLESICHLLEVRRGPRLGFKRLELLPGLPLPDARLHDDDVSPVETVLPAQHAVARMRRDQLCGSTSKRIDEDSRSSQHGLQLQDDLLAPLLLEIGPVVLPARDSLNSDDG